MKIPLLIMACMATRALGVDYTLAKEDFDGYEEGPLAGKGSANEGWTSAWTGDLSEHLSSIRGASSLAYQIPTRGRISSGNGHLRLKTSPEPIPGTVQQITRTFIPVKADLLIGFTFQMTGIGSGSDRFMVDVLDTTGRLIKSLEIKPSLSTPYPATHNATGENINRSGDLPNGNDSTIYFALIEIRRETTYYTTDHWINPADFFVRTWAGSVTPNNESLSSLRFRVSSSDTAGPSSVLSIDNLRIGFTWDSVVPLLPIGTQFPNFTFEPAHQLTWFADSNSKFQVEPTNDMSNWTSLMESTRGQDRNMEFFVPQAGSKRFFRVVSIPAP